MTSNVEHELSGWFTQVFIAITIATSCEPVRVSCMAHGELWPRQHNTEQTHRTVNLNSDVASRGNARVLGGRTDLDALREHGSGEAEREDRGLEHYCGVRGESEASGIGGARVRLGGKRGRGRELVRSRKAPARVYM